MPQVEQEAAIQTAAQPTREDLKSWLRARDPAFWPALCERSRRAACFDELWFLSTLRKRADAIGLGGSPAQRNLRLALVGGFNLYPLHELMEHLLAVCGYAARLFVGEYDNYAQEIIEGSSKLYAFAPEVVVVLPSPARCRYQGRLTDARELQQAQAAATSAQLLDLCRLVHERTRAELLLCNFPLPPGFDPGPYRTRTLGTDWNFRKAVNLELGLNAPPSVHICDVEFLAYRRGGLASRDSGAWFESKQPGAPDLLVDIARDAVATIQLLQRGPKKVLVLDLDNTLWGGVVGDDGLEGIEIGDTSPRGEAFKAFQRYIRSLLDRGVLLAVCSKNDRAKAIEPFERHPEMVLQPEHFVSFKANWNPKSENIREIAAELGLGLDSFVFVDDDPAEIDIVRRFVPEVSTLLLGPDPADHVTALEDSRLFEPLAITPEDAQRTGQYRQEAERRVLLSSATDLPAYLASLEMTAAIRPFSPVDAPRIAQLITKSNQFNLTTRRRTEAEVLALLEDPGFVTFTVRLSDRFGDHGLIAVVIGRIAPDATLEVDTWLMSCRVLNRQVEEETMNELMRLAAQYGCRRIRGVYRPTSKNQMVRGLYLRLGCQLVCDREDSAEYSLEVGSYHPFSTKIAVVERAYDTAARNCPAPANL